MIVKANSHLGFVCKDLEKSIAFYRDILGCKEKFTLYYGDMIPREKEKRNQMPKDLFEKINKIKDAKWIVYMEWLDGYFIELFNEVDAHRENPYDPANYGFTHFSFVVDDINDFYQDLLNKGAQGYIDILPQFTADQNDSMWFHDPDGNRIEVHQYGEHSFQIYGRN